jgi:uncharacterized repeat protein (TIGR01451 family)
MKSAFLKRTALLLGVLAVIVAPLATVSATSDTPWGPDRPTLTLNGNHTPGMDHVQFNSIVNNPNYGDERTFLDAKDSTVTTTGGYTDTTQVHAGEIVTLRTYVHNNADPSLNGTNNTGPGVALNTKVSIQLPTGTANSLRATSIISASNATPGSVFDTTDFQAGGAQFGVSYVSGSAVQYTHAVPSGLKLSDSIVSGGALIGNAAADGTIPGCFAYDSFVTIQVKINAPSISFTKQVAPAGTSSLATSLNAKVGDTDGWLLTATNTSSVTVTNPTIKDAMPAHLKLVPGSVIYYSGTFPNGKQLTDTDLFGAGQNLQDMAPGAVIHIKYRTTVNNDFAATDCNPTVTNNAVISATGVTPIYAAAVLTIAQNCTPVVPPKPPVTPPVTPPTTNLPDTGAGALAGVGGIGSIAYAGRAYLRSKKSLADALRK